MLYYIHRFMLNDFSEGCKYITGVKFQRCLYLKDEALEDLSYLKDSLQDLQIISCGNITDKGVKSLHILRSVFICEKITSFLGMFTKFQKATVSFVMSVCLSIHLSAWNISAPTGEIFMKIDV
jgi:hypothetical protein